jgi:hypothetical protein
LPEKQTSQKELPGRLSGVFRIHKLEKKMFAGGEGNKNYPGGQCEVCDAHKKQSETRNICKFCVVALNRESCFEKYH